MRKKEWKITMIFLGTVTVAVAVIALTTEGNLLDRLEPGGVTIEDLNQERTSREIIVIDRNKAREQIREKGYSPEQVEKFRSELEEQGFEVKDGKVVRKDR